MNRARSLLYGGRPVVGFQLVLVVFLLLFAAQGEGATARETRVKPSTAPNVPWTPPADLKTPPQKLPHLEIPEALQGREITVTLPEIVDYALRNNPLTREAWLAAQAAAGAAGSKRSPLYPQLSLDANAQRQKVSAVGGLFQFQQSTYGPSLSLTYLLFNFGGTRADAEDARQALIAANWTHNAAIQNVVLEVEQAYYQYSNAKAMRDAIRKDIDEAKANLDAAKARQDAGVATVADVLQAKTVLAQSRLNLEQVEGQIKATRGSLATAMGLPPDLPVETAPLPESVTVTGVSKQIRDILKKALTMRPDLAAARARVASAEAHVKKIRADGMPSITLSANASRVYYYHRPGSLPADNYSGEVLFHFPLFTGFKNSYDLLQAKAEAKQAKAQAETLKDEVMLQVWTSYANLQTAAQQVATSNDLLASAQESERVSQGRYKQGVGSILDLLTAQAALANARAQDVAARSNWLLSVAQLAHDTGVLSPHVSSQTAVEPQPSADSKENHESSSSRP